ncbi:MAG: glycosyltransferase family 2 protein [Acidobacteria bacterium]|jgi:glycosyltransferase involved in cell wall biosynthesis|nr:glycosyltransferase family 2 protein [Acidobacteriota bacterium]
MERETILKPGISVVVCCYNSAAVIVPTMQALSAQLIPTGINYEVVLVDNNCTDNTVHLAKDTWKNSPIPLHITRESRPGLIYARENGVFKANYDILLFVDDDNILEPDWVERLVDMFSRRPEVGAIGGYIEPLFAIEENEQWEKPAWFEKFSGMYACTPPHENPGISAFKQTLYGAGLSVRTQVIRNIFNSALPLFMVGKTKDTLSRGEDSEICLRIALMGWKLWYEKSLAMKHYLLKRRVNWEYVIQARKGGAYAEIILKIYRDLLEGQSPLKYKDLSVYISSLWENFWVLRIKNNDLFKIALEGDPISLRYIYLQGLTDAFLKLDKQEYNETREKISTFFASQKKNAFILSASF